VTLDLSYEAGELAEVVGIEEFGRRSLETWRLQGSSGAPILIDVHLPQTVKRIVVMGHGADNSRKARYVEVSGKAFTRHGTAVVAMDAPRHGDRPDAEPLAALPGVLPDVLEEWVRDHLLLLDTLVARWPGVPIGFAGFSMGGLFLVPLLTVDERVQAAAIVIAGSTRVSYPGRLDLGSAEVDALELTDPAVHAPDAGELPVLVLNADADEIVPRAAGLALYDAFEGPKEMVFMPGTHTEWGQAARWFRRLEQFFVENLG